MKLSEFKGEKAFEVVAAIMTPIAKIMKSDVMQNATVHSRMELAQLLLKADTGAVREILAILSDKVLGEYECTATTLMYDIMALVADDDFTALFISPGQKREEKPSRSASENAGAGA